MTEYVTAQIQDEELAAKWRRVAADYDGTKSDLIKDLINDEFEFRGLSLDEDIEAGVENDVPEIVDEYDPDSFDRELEAEEVDDILAHVDEPRLSSDHVSRDSCKQGRHVDVVTAVARYEMTSASKDDIRDLASELGWYTSHFLGNNKNQLDVPGKVMTRLGGSGRETEKVETNKTKQRAEEIWIKSVYLSVYGDGDDFENVQEIRPKLREMKDLIINEYEMVDNDDLVDIVATMLYNRDTPVLDPDVDAIDTPKDVVEWYDSEKANGWTDDDLAQMVDDFEALVDEYVAVVEE